MKSLQKKFYITTAIDYVNGKPHIGHALEKIQADVLARYARLNSRDVFFLTGTDENALKNVQAAEEARVPVAEFVASHAALFKDLLQRLSISNSDFIRTSAEERHIAGAKKFWSACKPEDIYKKKYQGLYCLGCEEFKLQKDLTHGECSEHPGKALQEIEEENYFFRLSGYQDVLRRLIEREEFVIVPEIRKNETMSFIKSGLEDFSISRSRERAKNWGIPVPGDESQVMYVWFDALSNYVTALGYAEDGDTFERYWKNGDEMVHLIGKGINRFHTIYWPAMLLSAGIRLPTKILIHGYITIDGQKMSKTVGNVIDPVELVEKYGTDPVRYYLLREIPSGEDGDFSVKKFEERYNADLANGLGNLVARVVTLADKLKVKNETLKITIKNSKFETELIEIKENYNRAIEEFRLNEALEHIWKLIKAADVYINDEKPWEQEKPDVIADVLSLILEITNLLEPFLPSTAQKIRDQIRIEGGEFLIEKRGNLFPRL